MSIVVVGLVVAGGLVVAALIFFMLVQARRHREAMVALSARMGWPMQEVDTELPRQMTGFSPFGMGSRRRARWVFDANVSGTACKVFEYQYETRTRRNGRTETTRHHFVVAVADVVLAGPGLEIRPETLLHKAYDALGGEDIDFESDEFSRRFWVKCNDRRFAYDTLTPDMMDYLLPHKGWLWQWRGRRLTVHRQGKLRPDGVEPLAHLVAGFVARLPRHRLAEAST